MKAVACLVLFYVCVKQTATAQPCEGRKGHTPSTAIAICSKGNYRFPPSINCFNRNFFLPGCTNQNTSYGDLNPLYFRFSAKTSGNLGFRIAARVPATDINWQLFDITGKRPDAIYTDATLTVAANWSGTVGETGASPAGSKLIQCRTLAGDGTFNPFSIMPTLAAGHTYLLVVSNLTVTGDFALTFEGGTAEIGNTDKQEVQLIPSGCSNTEFEILFSKPVHCSSISPDGSEISINPSAGLFQVIPVDCGNRNETSSLRLIFNQPPPSGDYTIAFSNGTDGNTFLDQCDVLLPSGINTSFTVQPFAVIQKIVIDSCAVSTIRLHLSKKVLCSSITADGSDFKIIGPANVIITNAAWNCESNETTTIDLKLSETVQQGGTYTISIVTGSDGNTLIDDCSAASPAGVLKSLIIPQPGNASFTYQLKEGCTIDTLELSHPALNGETQWHWVVNNMSSIVQNPVFYLTNSGTYSISLTTANNTCNAISEQSVTVNERLTADFLIASAVCSGELITMKNISKGATKWNWDFGSGSVSSSENPPPFHINATINAVYYVSLITANAICTASVTKQINVTANCSVYIPTAFTPNSDGLNDILKPSGNFNIQDMSFCVYNRYGEKIFTSTSSRHGWDGYRKGILQPSGQYLWTLRYTDQLSGKIRIQKGFVQLIY
jgi:gliding motility-associated-like protein